MTSTADEKGKKIELKIQKKIYYRFQFTLASPLAIGSGQGTETDKDIVRNHKGVPYIPATAIAGVCRSMFTDSEEEDDYFGMVPGYKEALEKQAAESKVKFYDAYIVPDTDGRLKYNIANRDFVALDKWKTAEPGAKFDMQILEPGVKFCCYMEQDFRDGDINVVHKIAQYWLNQDIYLGAKSTRGFGRIRDVSVKKREYKFTDTKSVSDWLKFDMYDDTCWEGADAVKAEGKTKKYHTISLNLELEGGISIRRYTSKVLPNETSDPDYEHLTVRQIENQNGESGEIPVIPGSAWAGAFLHRAELYMPGSTQKDFGFVDKSNGEKHKSNIRFSESQIQNAKPKIFSRNAIDRFSGGTIENALFTERTYYGGTTVLNISYEKELAENLKKALAASICDLHFGMLPIGGLTSIGRGIFHINSINGEKICEKDIYAMVLKMMGGDTNGAE